LYKAFRNRRSREACAILVAVVAVFLAAHLQEDRAFSRIQEGGTHFNAGNLWRKKGDYRRAATEYERAT
jgi:hypothetical protein